MTNAPLQLCGSMINYSDTEVNALQVSLEYKYIQMGLEMVVSNEKFTPHPSFYDNNTFTFAQR